MTIGAVAFILGYLSKFFLESTALQLAVGIGTFTLGIIILLIIKIHIPLQIIVQEMKALLTGKSYRKIMTDKRNEIGVLAHFFNEITRNLEHISIDVKDHQRIKKELNVAQKIQRDLLPEKIPNLPGLEITAKTRPASEIGGDTFNFFPEENRTLFYIGDSTGHGLPAGLVMVMVDTLITTFMKMYPKITDVMIQLNKYLKPHLQTTMFMTMILMGWDHKSQMKWVGAGHEYVIHVQTTKKEIVSTPSGGIAVGMLADNTAMVKEQTITLEENDFVVLFTDGIVEAKNVMGEIYTLECLKELIKRVMTPELTSEELFNKIAIDVGRFMEGHIQEDDMTLIVAKKTSHKTEVADETTEWSTEEISAKERAPLNEESA